MGGDQEKKGLPGRMEEQAPAMEKTALISEEIFCYVSNYLDCIVAQGTQLTKLQQHSLLNENNCELKF